MILALEGLSRRIGGGLAAASRRPALRRPPGRAPSPWARRNALRIKRNEPTARKQLRSVRNARSLAKPALLHKGGAKGPAGRHVHRGPCFKSGLLLPQGIISLTAPFPLCTAGQWTLEALRAQTLQAGARLSSQPGAKAVHKRGKPRRIGQRFGRALGRSGRGALKSGAPDWGAGPCKIQGAQNFQATFIETVREVLHMALRPATERAMLCLVLALTPQCRAGPPWRPMARSGWPGQDTGQRH